MENINTWIAQNLKRIRKEKGLTLDDLAEISGVSKSMLSEIERGATNPTILVLWKIAEGLKTPLTRLMTGDDLAFTVVRRSQQTMIDQTEGYQISSVFPYHEAHKTEILNLELAPRARLSNSGHRNGVDEVVLLVSGAVHLMLGDESLHLEAGDAVRFKGELAHAFDNEGDEPAVLINMLYYR